MVVVATEDIVVYCDHARCRRKALVLKGDSIVITAKHDGEYHISVIPLDKLLYRQVENSDEESYAKQGLRIL